MLCCVTLCRLSISCSEGAVSQPCIRLSSSQAWGISFSLTERVSEREERDRKKRGTLTVSCGSRAVHFQPHTVRIPIHSSKTETTHTHTTSLFHFAMYKAISMTQCIQYTFSFLLRCFAPKHSKESHK